MVSEEIIRQVFSIRTKPGYGTAFSVRIANKQYLITARHVLDGDGSHKISESIDIDIFHENKWKEITCAVVGVGNIDCDVVVLAPPFLLANFAEVPLGTKSIFYSQDVYFLGFPYNLKGDIGRENNNFPLPYVKKAIVSMINGPDMPNIVLDGINNSGFSGGPVVFRNSAGLLQIAAVISDYDYVRESTFVGDSDVVGPYTYEGNTGLINACSIDFAIDLIKSNPIGISMV